MPRAPQGPTARPTRSRAGRGELEDPVDLTSMIDVVFLLLIFFMVTSTMASQADMVVPEVRNAIGVDTATATFITLLEPPAAQSEATIIIGDGLGPVVTTDDEVREAIEAV